MGRKMLVLKGLLEWSAGMTWCVPKVPSASLLGQCHIFPVNPPVLQESW